MRHGITLTGVSVTELRKLLRASRDSHILPQPFLILWSAQLSNSSREETTPMWGHWGRHPKDRRDAWIGRGAGWSEAFGIDLPTDRETEARLRALSPSVSASVP